MAINKLKIMLSFMKEVNNGNMPTGLLTANFTILSMLVKMEASSLEPLLSAVVKGIKFGCVTPKESNLL